MASIRKIIVFNRLLSIQPSRQLSVSCCRLRRKVPPARDESKRNLQGDALVERLKRRDEDITRQEPYKMDVAAVVERFKLEIDEEERKKHDIQGELMQRELAEREQALKNVAILTKSNEELKKQREKQNLLEEEEMLLKEKEMKLLLQRQKEETSRKNTELVLRVIEESQSFVTPENLDEKISDALVNETNYNYAIKASGEKIHSTKPPGNLDGWKGANPSAYALGGIHPGSGEWNFIFKSSKTPESVEQ